MKKISKRKVNILLMAIIFCMSAVAIAFFGGVMRKMQHQYDVEKADHLARTGAMVLSPSDVKALKEDVSEIYDSTPNRVSNDAMDTIEYKGYIAHFSDVENTDEFNSVYSVLKRLEEINKVDCMYLAYTDKPTGAIVYLADADDTSVCHPGSFDYIRGDDKVVLEKPETGLSSSLSSNSAYGWVLSRGVPMRDKTGDVIAYVCVDISQKQSVDQINRILLNTALGVMIIALLLWVVTRFVSGGIVSEEK